MVFSGNRSSGGVNRGAKSVITLTADDADAMAEECATVRAASPTVWANGQVVAGTKLVAEPNPRRQLHVSDGLQLADGTRRFLFRRPTFMARPRSACWAKPSRENLFQPPIASGR